jgi:uncharacterized protein (DUF3820 family)
MDLITNAADSYAMAFKELSTEEKWRIRKAVLYGASLTKVTPVKTVEPSEEITDNHAMPFGKYMGKKMIEVPAVYMMWLYDNNCNHAGVKKYIIDNFQAIKQEANKVKK